MVIILPESPLFWIAFAFWFVIVSFCVYVAVRMIWTRLHWIMKAALAIFWLGYPIDWLLGVTVLSIWFMEFPDLTEGTISQRCKKHRNDSRLAAFIWGEIIKVDPQHLGGG